MKKLIMSAIMLLFSFSSIGNAATIEMFFEDDNGGHQSLEFESDIDYSNGLGLIQFGNVSIFNEDKLYELYPQSSRHHYTRYSNDYHNFRFYVEAISKAEYPWFQKDKFTRAEIYSESITYLGYDRITEITPDLLEEIFDNMVEQPYFFCYNFGYSNVSGFDHGSGNTTLTSWNYKTATVPIPPTLWLFGSGLIGLFGVSRRKNLQIERK